MSYDEQYQTLLNLQKEIERAQIGADISWVNSSGYIIFFMQTGFCLLESGTARHKHHNHTILLQLLNAMGCVFGWWILGDAFAYGDDVSHFIGTNYYAGKSLLENPIKMADWIFDMGSAATAGKIVSGAILERVFAYSYLLFSVFISAWIYPVARKYLIYLLFSPLVLARTGMAEAIRVY
jgi:Amt family ammonium transporter